MTSDVRTVVWKELREAFVRQTGAGGAAAGFRPIVVLAVGLGIFIPWSAGRSWTGVPAIGVAAGLACMAVITTVPDSFAGERDRKTLETLLTSRLSDRSILLGKLAAAAMLGLAAAVLVLLVSLVTVNLTSDGHGLILYTPLELVAALAAAALAGTIVANVGVMTSLRAPSAMAAQRVMGLGLLGLGAGGAALFGALPAGWKTSLDRLAEEVGTESPVLLVAIGAAVLVLLNLVVFAVAVSLFRRPKLVRA